MATGEGIKLETVVNPIKFAAIVRSTKPLQEKQPITQFDMSEKKLPLTQFMSGKKEKKGF
jgi:hypothetical protein